MYGDRIYLSNIFIAKYGYTTGLENIERNCFSIYPNPTTNTLTIQLNSPITNGSIILTNIVGQVVYTAAINLKSKIINLKSLPSGLYFVQVVTDKGSVVKKVIKQ